MKQKKFLYTYSQNNNILCDALQEKVTYVGNIISKFFTKSDSRHPYQHVPEEYKAYCSTEPEKWVHKVRILKNVLLRKLCLKFSEDIKMKKIYVLALSIPIWLKFGCETFDVYMY